MSQGYLQRSSFLGDISAAAWKSAPGREALSQGAVEGAGGPTDSRARAFPRSRHGNGRRVLDSDSPDPAAPREAHGHLRGSHGELGRLARDSRVPKDLRPPRVHDSRIPVQFQVTGARAAPRPSPPPLLRPRPPPAAPTPPARAPWLPGPRSRPQGCGASS